MPNKNFRARRDSSSSEEENAAETKPEAIKEKIEELKLLQKTRERQHGIDAYALAIGEQETAGAKVNALVDDPWKTKTGGLVDMKKIKEKRGNEIVKNMHSNFARETNQRDEDAEMQKFIEEQLRLKKEQEKLSASGGEVGAAGSESGVGGGGVAKFKRPEDALFDVPKYLIENQSKHKSEESLSEQMLSGIPEVDLGVDERIRNIEETEKAKQRLAKASRTGGHRGATAADDADNQYAPHNLSVNFVQHKRFDDALINPDHMVKFKVPRVNQAQKPDNQPVVGDAPKHELLKQAAANQLQQQNSHHHHHKPRRPQTGGTGSAGGGGGGVQTPAPAPEEIIEQLEKKIASDADPAPEELAGTSAGNSSRSRQGGHKRQNVERATDDYCLERFKKNMRHGRSSKIKIA